MLKGKRILVSMAAGLIMMIGYVIYALGNSAPVADDMKAWATLMLIFIAVSVIVQVAVQIVFHIIASISLVIKENETDKRILDRIISSEMAEDERDKQIGLSSAHIGHACLGAGFVVMLFALMFDAPAALALNILLGAAFIASMAEGIISIHLYEVGTQRRCKEDGDDQRSRYHK